MVEGFEVEGLLTTTGMGAVLSKGSTPPKPVYKLQAKPALPEDGHVWVRRTCIV
jgi:hypothetical protein